MGDFGQDTLRSVPTTVALEWPCRIGTWKRRQAARIAIKAVVIDIGETITSDTRYWADRAIWLDVCWRRAPRAGSRPHARGDLPGIDAARPALVAGPAVAGMVRLGESHGLGVDLLWSRRIRQRLVLAGLLRTVKPDALLVLGERCRVGWVERAWTAATAGAPRPWVLARAGRGAGAGHAHCSRPGCGRGARCGRPTRGWCAGQPTAWRGRRESSPHLPRSGERPVVAEHRRIEQGVDVHAVGQAVARLLTEFSSALLQHHVLW